METDCLIKEKKCDTLNLQPVLVFLNLRHMKWKNAKKIPMFPPRAAAAEVGVSNARFMSWQENYVNK